AISPRFAIRIFLNMAKGAPARRRPPQRSGRMLKSASPNWTGCPFSWCTFTISPATSASISFMSFMASMMQRTWPTLTRSPVPTKGGELGSGDRKNVPTIGLRSTTRPASSGARAAGAAIPAGAAGATGTAGATEGAKGGGAAAWLGELAAALRIRSFIPSSSSSNSSISFSSRIWRISLSSLRSNEPPWRLSGSAADSGKRAIIPVPAQACQSFTRIAPPRGRALLELLLQRQRGQAQGEAGAPHQGARCQRGEEEILLRDGHDDRGHLLRHHRQLAQVAQARVAGRGGAGPQQRRVLRGHRLQVRVRPHHELLDGDPVGGHDHEHTRLRHPRGHPLQGLAEACHASPFLTAASRPSS